jgi:Na+/melibiose symporter-like transporter
MVNTYVTTATTLRLVYYYVNVKSIDTRDKQQGARYVTVVFTVLNFILMVIRVKSTQTSPPAGDCIVATIYGGRYRMHKGEAR